MKRVEKWLIDGVSDPDAARRNTRIRFEQWAKNPVCEANTIAAVHNVRMEKVAAEEGVKGSFGQSPFALSRGNRFEGALFFDKAARLLEELIKKDVLPAGAAGFLDLRLRMNGGPRLRSLEESIAETSKLLEQAAAATTAKDRAAIPALVAGATVRIPRGVMLPEAVLISRWPGWRPQPGE